MASLCLGGKGEKTYNVSHKNTLWEIKTAGGKGHDYDQKPSKLFSISNVKFDVAALIITVQQLHKNMNVYDQIAGKM